MENVTPEQFDKIVRTNKLDASLDAVLKDSQREMENAKDIEELKAACRRFLSGLYDIFAREAAAAIARQVIQRKIVSNQFDI